MSRDKRSFVFPNTEVSGHASSSIEQLIKALSDPTRLKILSILSTGSKSLDTIAKELKLDKKKKPNVRKHLEKLKDRNLVFQVERGNYCLVCPELINNILGFLEKAWIEIHETFYSLTKARKAYNDDIIKNTDRSRLDFLIAFDKVLKTSIFTRAGGEIRAYYIDMAQRRQYDWSRLRTI